MNRPLVEAELDRRMPERAKMRPDDADGFRTAWAVLERRAWHRWDLPWDEAPGWDGIAWDREAHPSLDEALSIRRERRRPFSARLLRLNGSVQDDGRPHTKAPCTGASPPWTQRLELHDGQAVAARLPAWPVADAWPQRAPAVDLPPGPTSGHGQSRMFWVARA
ncbi:hypothetical protein [Nonomuraea terrae]|uniref:hypothetical protein n=1 Tax=Nonomuraea terrae TaxID=2530383 RepID=UPI001CB6BD73|nr:hypothetical protein [Nonomuraea terrae]